MYKILYFAMLALCVSCTCNRTEQTTNAVEDSISMEKSAEELSLIEEQINSIPMPDAFKTLNYGELLWDEVKNYMNEVARRPDFKNFETAPYNEIGFALVDFQEDPTKTLKDGWGWLLILLKSKPGLLLEGGYTSDGSYYDFNYNYDFSSDSNGTYAIKIHDDENDKDVFCFFSTSQESEWSYKYYEIESLFCVYCDGEEPLPFSKYQGVIFYNSDEDQWYSDIHNGSAHKEYFDESTTKQKITKEEAESYIREWENGIIKNIPFTPLSPLMKN